MAELINKWEVVSKLIQLENEYTFFKEEWDAQILYRKICELEIAIGKTPGMRLVRCEKCAHGSHVDCPEGRVWCDKMCRYMVFDGYCSYGERGSDGNGR